ncbi:hypothetical protein VTO73DRAFT_2021 [Trametes versicolor]
MARTVTRRCIPPNLRAERRAAFKNGKWPSEEEYEALFNKIHNAGCRWYTRKVHHNFRSRQRNNTRAPALPLTMGRDLNESPTPAPIDDQPAGRHTIEVGGSGMGNDSDVPPMSAVNDDHATVIPTTESSPSVAGTLDAAGIADIMLALNGCSPAIHGEIQGAQNPTAAHFRQWASSSNVPAVAVFRLWEVIHPIAE